MRNNSHFSVDSYPTRKSEKGFTLLELMIAMVVFLIVISSIYGVLQVAQNSRKLVNQQVQLNKNARIAINLIGRDTYNAGFGYPVASTVVLPDNRISATLGIPDDFDSSRDTVPPIIAANDLLTNTFNSAANVKTDQITFLFKDSRFNLVGDVGKEVSQPLSIKAATTNVDGIDEIIPLSGSNSKCHLNDLMIITGNRGSTLGVITKITGIDTVQFSNGDTLGFNQTGILGLLRGIAVPASMQRVRLVSYFVTLDGTLTRRDFANDEPAVNATGQKWVDEPLVYGVEDFQIKYILDDGTVIDNPSAGADKIAGNADDVQANLARVRQIRYTISVKGSELNAAGQPYRITMTSTFSTRNLGYDAS